MTDDTRAIAADIDGIEIEWDAAVPAARVANDDSLATLLLVSRLGSVGVRPLKASEFWSLLKRLGVGSPWTLGPDGVTETAGGESEDSGEGPSVLVGKSEDQLVRDCGVPESLAGRVERLTHRAMSFAFELERLEQSGIRTLTVYDEHYPRHWLDRLRAKAPPVVHGAGALQLLDTPGLGVVGSRDVAEAGGEVAKEVARLAAGRNNCCRCSGIADARLLTPRECFLSLCVWCSPMVA